MIEAQFFTFDTANANLPNGWRARTAANNAEAKVLVVDAICANASARPARDLPGEAAQREPTGPPRAPLSGVAGLH